MEAQSQSSISKEIKEELTYFSTRMQSNKSLLFERKEEISNLIKNFAETLKEHEQVSKLSNTLGDQNQIDSVKDLLNCLFVAVQKDFCLIRKDNENRWKYALFTEYLNSSAGDKEQVKAKITENLMKYLYFIYYKSNGDTIRTMEEEMKVYTDTKELIENSIEKTKAIYSEFADKLVLHLDKIAKSEFDLDLISETQEQDIMKEITRLEVILNSTPDSNRKEVEFLQQDKEFLKQQILSEVEKLDDLQNLDRDFRQDVEAFRKSGELSDSECTKALEESTYLKEILEVKTKIKEMESKLTAIDEEIYELASPIHCRNKIEKAKLKLQSQEEQNTLNSLRILLKELSNVEKALLEEKEYYSLTKEVIKHKINFTDRINQLRAGEGNYNEKTLINLIEAEKEIKEEVTAWSSSEEFINSQIIQNINFIYLLDNQDTKLDDTAYEELKDLPDLDYQLELHNFINHKAKEISSNSNSNLFKKLSENAVKITTSGTANSLNLCLSNLTKFTQLITEDLNNFKLTYPKKIVILTNKYEKKLLELIEKLEKAEINNIN